MAREPRTTPREPPWTAARADNEHGRSFGGGAAESATSLVRPPTQRVASPKAPERRQAEGNEAGTQHKNPALGAGLAFGQETRRIFMTLFFGLCIIRR